MLKIEPMGAETIIFETVVGQPPIGQSGPETYTGIDLMRQVSFTITRPQRVRLSEIEAVAGKNIVQNINRSGKIQLTTDKACPLCRFTWDAPNHPANVGWNILYSISTKVGIFAITEATMRGMDERLTLTLYEGDWVWHGGEVTVFE